MKLRKIMNKKAEMPFWLVMLIVALIFAMTVLVLMTGGINKIKQSFTQIQIQATAQSDCLTKNPSEDLDGDGWHNTKKYTDGSGKEIACDMYPSDGTRH